MQISLLEVAPRTIAAVRVKALLSRWPNEFMHSLDKVWAAIRAGHIRKAGHNVMIYRPHEDGTADIECGVETGARFEPVGEVVCVESPSGQVAAAVHVGPYRELTRTHDAVAKWTERNGYRFAGVCWEVYGDWQEDESKLTTEIFHLVRK